MLALRKGKGKEGVSSVQVQGLGQMRPQSPSSSLAPAKSPSDKSAAGICKSNSSSSVKPSVKPSAEDGSNKVNDHGNRNGNGNGNGKGNGNVDADNIMDDLPPYTNSLQLLSICRRKREFNSSLNKARRRNWDVIWLLLDGTALRIYEPLKEEKDAFEGTNVHYGLNSSTALAMARSRLDTPPPSTRSATPVPVPTVSTTSLLYQSTTTTTNSSPDLSRVHPQRLRPSWKLNTNTNNSNSEYDLTIGPSMSLSRSGITPLSFLPSRVPKPDFTSITSITSTTSTTSGSKRTLLRQYPLRHAICTRLDPVAEALKQKQNLPRREFVLRFILENGKQFLVQFNSKRETIAWLQFMSIAAPLSLDLDERPMPAPAQYPRNRAATARHIQNQETRENRNRIGATNDAYASTENIRNGSMNQSGRRSRTNRPQTAPAAIDSTRLHSSPHPPHSYSYSSHNPHSLNATSSFLSLHRRHQHQPHTHTPQIQRGQSAQLAQQGIASNPDPNSNPDLDLYVDSDEDLDLDLEMDHLPPPTRPTFIRSLSSVDQARRLGVTVQ